MNTKESIELITVLADVVKTNRGLFGNEATMRSANERVRNICSEINEKKISPKEK